MYRYSYIYTFMYVLLNIKNEYFILSTYTMKNEGWGFQVDQTPASSHLFHSKRWAPI